MADTSFVRRLVVFTCCLSSLLFNGEANATATTSAADRSKHEKRAMATTDVCWGVVRWSTAVVTVVSWSTASLRFIGAPWSTDARGWGDTAVYRISPKSITFSTGTANVADEY